MTTYWQYDKKQITELLVGRKVTKIESDTLLLNNGRVLTLAGNVGGCSCGSGDYELTELNGVDNVITAVEFVDSPSGDDYDDDDSYVGPGHYKIFVFADNQKINLATFEGNDGSGYYGTGYSIEVQVP